MLTCNCGCNSCVQKNAKFIKFVSHGLPLGGEWRNSETTAKKPSIVHQQMH
jgi:hypothetical protein